MENKNWGLVVIVSALTAISVALVMGNFRTSSQLSSTLNRSEMSNLMQNTMGKAEDHEVPLKLAWQRKQSLDFEIKNGAKEFKLTADPIRFEYADDKTILAWGYNGQIPGPEIRVTEGDKVRIVFTNNLPKATTIHWHGINVPNSQDGVPGLTQKPIQPGETYIYEFVARPAGTRFYHTHGSSHKDEAQQLDMGLSGAFIIEPIGYQKPDKEYTLLLDEWQVSPMAEVTAFTMLNRALAHGEMAGESMMNMSMMSGGHMMDYNLFTINGRSFPYTDPINVKQGDRVRLRLVNAGTSTTHPMHLHGHQFRIISVDGNPVPQAAQLTRNTITLHPGETYDIEFIANNPGIWVFHCHELHHADDGMIVPLVYDGFTLPEIESSSAMDHH